jgi:hypothetical protein
MMRRERRTGDQVAPTATTDYIVDAGLPGA